MQVACCCGQAFTVPGDRFPHRLSCHLCGRKLMVLADGSTHEVRPVSVQFSCSCGHPFTVGSEEFPRQVRCPRCGRQFSVLDTGETIDMPESVGTKRDVTSFQAPHATSILSAEMVRAVRVSEVDVQEELRQLDQAWEKDRKQFVWLNLFGMSIIPSMRLSVIFGITWMTAWLTIMAMCAYLGWQDVLGQGWVYPPLVGVGLALYLAAKSEAYETAEADWQRKRIAVIAKQEAKADEV